MMDVIEVCWTFVKIVIQIIFSELVGNADLLE